MSGSLQRGWRTTNRPGRMTLPHYDDQRCNCLQSIVFLCPFLNSILLCLEIILLCFFFRKARLICDIGSELFKKECNSFGLFEAGRMERVVWWDSGNPPLEIVDSNSIVTSHSHSTLVKSQQTVSEAAIIQLSVDCPLSPFKKHPQMRS